MRTTIRTNDRSGPFLYDSNGIATSSKSLKWNASTNIRVSTGDMNCFPARATQRNSVRGGKVGRGFPWWMPVCGAYPRRDGSTSACAQCWFLFSATTWIRIGGKGFITWLDSSWTTSPEFTTRSSKCRRVLQVSIRLESTIQ